MKFDTIKDRIEYIRRQKGLTYRQLAEIIGSISGDAVRKAIQKNNLKDYYINIISEKLRINKDWLLKGEGDIELYAEPNKYYTKQSGTFREALKEYLKEYDINQKELAEIIGVSQQAINSMLASDSRLRRATKDKFISKLIGFKEYLEKYKLKTTIKEDIQDYQVAEKQLKHGKAQPVNPVKLTNSEVEFVLYALTEHEQQLLKNNNYSTWKKNVRLEAQNEILQKVARMRLENVGKLSK